MRSTGKNYNLTPHIFAMVFASFLALPTSASADDFFVITAAFHTQKEAQESAAVNGGWVLNTNFYTKLTPGVYAVVRGPFKTKSDADTQLASLQSYSNFKSSYVRDAGNLNIEIKIGNKAINPQVLAALLGELRIDVTENAGGSNPCEPQGPYSSISLSYVTAERGIDEKKNKETEQPKDVKLEIGGFWQMKDTGEIGRMRICTE